MVPVCTSHVSGRQYGRVALGWLVVVVALVVIHPAPSDAQTVVRDIDQPARRPFQVEQTEQVTLRSSTPDETFAIADVPPGTRLVIEHISLRASSREAIVQGGRQPRFLINASLVTKADTVAATHQLVATRTDFDTASSNSVSQPIRAYADGGSQVFLRIGGNTEGSSHSIQVRVAVSGYLVEVPIEAPPDGR